jgi:putative tricarboxylic transport membrane protein
MKLDAHAALPLVMGLVSPILTSDTIPAILLGTPGAACAAAVVDGYPMAQKGQAGRALGAAIVSTTMGGVIGAAVIVIAIPILKPLVLFFGTPEFLALSLLSVSAVAVLSKGNILKGIGAAGLGLLFSMVGADPIRYVVRWDFGFSYLRDPIDVIPVAIGIFAIPEILEMCAKGTSVSRVPAQAMQGRYEGLLDCLREWKLVLSSSVIGAFVGFLPGLGSSVAAWMCYSWSVISSKDKSQFGKGDVRGVIGSEAGVHASAGGHLIPAIAFGVPGSVVAALVLVVFWAVGITPGPALLTEHVDLVFLIVWSTAIADIISGAVCYALANKMTMITKIEPHLLGPLVLTIVFVGTLYSTSNVAGLVLLLGFGILGWLMKTGGWARPALLLGFILGPIIEKYYFQSTMLYGNSWLLRPAVMVILAFAVGVICVGVGIDRRAARAGKAEDAAVLAAATAGDE